MYIADALSRVFLKEHRETLLDEELEVNWMNHQLKGEADDPEERLKIRKTI